LFNPPFFSVALVNSKAC